MSNPINILLIEDDADDIELLEEALKSNKISYQLTSIKEGDKVMSYLRADILVPDIIVLDFNLPKLHGREILSLIKSSEKFGTVPLVVLTTSASKEDISFAKDMGANHYITKPTSINDFNRAVATIVETAGIS